MCNADGLQQGAAVKGAAGASGAGAALAKTREQEQGAARGDGLAQRARPERAADQAAGADGAAAGSKGGGAGGSAAGGGVGGGTNGGVALVKKAGDTEDYSDSTS